MARRLKKQHMANNPVQIVLNDDAFLRAPEPGRSGPEKDFFDGNDAKFQAHKVRMLSALDQIDRSLTTSPMGPLAYVRVKMRMEAIAKSYRPNRALLTSDLFPCVGAGAPGELYFRMPRVHLHRLRSRMQQASDHAELRRPSTGGAPYLLVNRERSELGAIESIEITPPASKRTFSAADAVSALLHPSAASGYVIELFEQAPLQMSASDDVLGLRQSFDTLQQLLQQTGGGLYAALLPSPGGVQALEIVLTQSRDAPRIEDLRAVQSDLLPRRELIEEDTTRHEQVLSMIANHSLVRRIRAPIIVLPSETSTANAPDAFNLPKRADHSIYPKVGVVDTGLAAHLDEWIIHRHDFLNAGDFDPKHGTLVSGVLVAARAANGADVGREADGCDLVDIALLPTRPFLDVYGRRGFEAFLEELEAAVREARDTYGFRIFNMSLNLCTPVEQDQYSAYAARLDAIQDRLGILIVNSAGNLDVVDWRPAWPKTPRQALAALATRTVPDTIYMPCETVRGLAVGAVNPPGGSHLAGAPATYSRRGPGLRVGVKPDLGHYGGVGDNTNGHCAFSSCDHDGTSCQVRGTSFAAPLVAKTLAVLDVLTEEKLYARTLRAFLIHNARIPQPLDNRTLKEIARQFVGFGQPTDAANMLETDDNSITLVFESRLTVGARKPAILRFPFSWPASLVDPATRACSGHVKMTLVYEPPLDPAFGTEFVRINLDAKLQQRQPTNRRDGSPSWRDQIKQVFLPRNTGLTPPERALIEHGLKWWPTKRYEDDFGDGIGEHTEWRLEVGSLVRAEADFPAEGVPFSLILTIDDPERRRPIFQEVRRQLVTRQVELHDIKTAIRLRPRGRS
jgi:hypothetical protein